MKCDFEDKNLCGYKQLTNDNFDWKWNSKATSSIGTGPSQDHTYSTAKGMLYSIIYMCIYMSIAAVVKSMLG